MKNNKKQSNKQRHKDLWGLPNVGYVFDGGYLAYIMWIINGVLKNS